MSADLGALGRIEETFEQGAENRRIDLSPLHRADGDEQAKVALIERQGLLSVEEAAVEISDKFIADAPACRHRVKNFVKQGLGLLISIADVELAQRLAKKAFG
jgi:hypothetical protein